MWGFFLAVILLSNSMELNNSVVHLGVGCAVCSSSPATRIWQFQSPREVCSVVTHSSLLSLQERTLGSREDTWLCTPSLSGLVQSWSWIPRAWLHVCQPEAPLSLWPVLLLQQIKTRPEQPGKKAPHLYAMAQGKPAHFIRFWSLPIPHPQHAVKCRYFSVFQP